MKSKFESLRAFLRANAFPITLFAIVRVWTLVWASFVAAFVAPSAEATKHLNGVEPLRDAVIAPWQRWDTIWYSKIAVEGYAADVRVVFAPLYPLLMRVVSPLTGDNVVAAGLLISSVAALASFILLYQLAREMFDEGAARRALILLAVFPTTFYLFAAYTEALFLALILGAFLYMRRGQWIRTALLAGLAAMTRAQGIFLLAPFAFEFWDQATRKKISWRKGWTLGLIALGSIAQLAYLSLQFGGPEVWWRAQTIWHRTAFPWQSIGQVLNVIFNAASGLEAVLSAIQGGMELLLLVTVVWSARRLPLAFTAYAAILAFPPLFLITTYSSQYPLIGVGRFALLAFPFFLLYGTLPPRPWQLFAIGVSFLLQILWMMLFVAWVFVH